MDSYRSVLEVLKFISDIDVLRNTNFVSSKWKAASDSQELWMTFSDSFKLSVGFPFTKAKYQELLAGANLFLMTKAVCHQYLVSEGTKYRLYNCIKGSLKDVCVSKLFNLDLTSVNVVPGGNIVFCGGNSKAAYIYLSETKVMRKLENMHVGRRNSGVICDSKDLYVFGGEYRESYLNSCEKLNLATRKWEKLPNMLAARRGMKPCRYQSTIYLCGGAKVRDSIKHEKFDIASREFTQMSLNLPRKITPLLTFVQDQLLVIITNDRVWKYQAESLECVENVSHPCVDEYCLSPLANPVVLQQFVFYTTSRSVYKLELQDFRLSVCYDMHP